jgi:hypothetical protein
MGRVASVARWICPRCHAPLRYPMALCTPCGRFGNSTARFPDGTIERAEPDRNGHPQQTGGEVK